MLWNTKKSSLEDRFEIESGLDESHVYLEAVINK